MGWWLFTRPLISRSLDPHINWQLDLLTDLMVRDRESQGEREREERIYIYTYIYICAHAYVQVMRAYTI
jgi:hypothetical protein